MNQSTQRRLLLAVLWLVATASFGAAHAQTYPWKAQFRFPGTFFPSYAIAAAGKDANGPLDKPGVFGYFDSASFGVLVQDTPKGSVVKVRISVPEIGVAGEIESTPQPTDKPRPVMPRLTASPARLVAIDQPISTEVVFEVSVDGKSMGEQRQPLRIRAITDTPLLHCPKGQSCQDYHQYLAAYVNENNPVIDVVLHDALSIPAIPVKNFTGTESGDASTLEQIWSIWYLFQRRRVTYSNILTTSEVNEELQSQAVRSIVQSLKNSEANCVDGTVLFASILRKIGIEPIIIFVPGHAFLGFYLDKQGTRRAYLETTLINSPDSPFYQNAPTKTGINLAQVFRTDPNIAKSKDSFNRAIDAGAQEFRAAEPYFFKKPGYTFLPIRKAREAGILPLPM